MGLMDADVTGPADATRAILVIYGISFSYILFVSID